MIKEITIKFGTELKPTKASWKSQLYNLYIYIYVCMYVYKVNVIVRQTKNRITFFWVVFWKPQIM